MKKAGFTLGELLVVVLIIGVLSAVALPQYRRSLNRARVAEARQILPAIFDARERLIVETPGIGWDTATEPGLPGWANQISFTRLDTTLKGHVQAGNTHVWQTPNFEYQLFASEEGDNVVFDDVSARWKRGTGRFNLHNTMLYYNGLATDSNDPLRCCPAADATEDFCQLLGIARATRCPAGN